MSTPDELREAIDAINEKYECRQVVQETLDAVIASLPYGDLTSSNPIEQDRNHGIAMVEELLQSAKSNKGADNE
jgi:hypothetical protein